MKVQVRNGKQVNVKPANGVEGFLLQSGVDGTWSFRVYETEDKRQFTDYELFHQDLQITIDSDEMASFYDDGENQWLDYSPQVLGLEISDET